MSKRSGAELLRIRKIKQCKKEATTKTPGGTPRTASERKAAMFEDAVSAADAETSFPTAKSYGLLMVRCFWEHFAKFDPTNDVANTLKREQPSFTKGVLRFLNKGRGKSPHSGAHAKAVDKELSAYLAERRQELHKLQREALRVHSTTSHPSPPPRPSPPLPDQQKDARTIVERSTLTEDRLLFYHGSTLDIQKCATVGDRLVEDVNRALNCLFCGEVVFASPHAPTGARGIGCYRQHHHGSWAHAGPGSMWAELFVPSLDRIAQRNINVGAHTPLYFPFVNDTKQDHQPMSLIKIGQGKYSQIFAPCNTLETDKPVDLTDWPPMLVRVDKNGVRRAKNVAIRVPRINATDCAIADGSLPNAHEEAFNMCEAAVSGFGPSLLVAFFLPDPDPPSADKLPRHAFRFITISKRQKASLQQRSRTWGTTAPLGSLSLHSNTALPDNVTTYFQMLVDTVFEYSAREIIFLDSTRSNFMDEEAVVPSGVVPAQRLQSVRCVNVIDLDPRFYHRVPGAGPQSVFLLNISLVLAHIRRVDTKRTLMRLLLQVRLRGGLSIANLVKKIYQEQKHSVSWLCAITWYEIPESWKPEIVSDWRVSVVRQIQQIVGYYFFRCERDDNGRKALSAYQTARRGSNQHGVDEARAHFNAAYVTGGGMHAARHFLYATKHQQLRCSLILTILMYVDPTLFDSPDILKEEPFYPPLSLDTVGGDEESYLGLTLKKSRPNRR